jgi:hypothetical protein
MHSWSGWEDDFWIGCWKHQKKLKTRLGNEFIEK